MPALAKMIPIGQYLDHGESVEIARPAVAAAYKAYVDQSAGKRRILKPGDRIPLGGVDVETIMLARADGRTLAHDILAPLPLPPFTNSAVDGYAVRSRDLPGHEEAAFPVTGRVQAGASAREPVKPGLDFLFT